MKQSSEVQGINRLRLFERTADIFCKRDSPMAPIATTPLHKNDYAQPIEAE